MEKVLKKRWSRDSFDFCTLLALLQQVLSVEYRVLTLSADSESDSEVDEPLEAGWKMGKGSSK